MRLEDAVRARGTQRAEHNDKNENKRRVKETKEGTEASEDKATVAEWPLLSEEQRQTHLGPWA